MPVRGIGRRPRLLIERRRADPLHARHRGARPHADGLSTLVTTDAARVVPGRRSSFVGRKAELDRIATALADSPLVTVTGLGGTGKTRVALEAAARLAPVFRDGTEVIDLTGARTPDAVVAAFCAPFVARSKGERGRSTDPLEELATALRSRQVLLVVDNCEHVVDVAATTIDRLLAPSTPLRVLATSRENLRLAGEVVVRLEPLAVTPSTPDEPSDAVRLFTDRANAVRSDFAVDADNLGSVVAICAKLDGIPLAIELAAARVAQMSTTEIAELFDDHALSIPARAINTADRHRTMTATLDWSYDLLRPDEQAVFRRLAVFAAGANLDAIRWVCASESATSHEVLDLVGGLVDKNLLVPERAPSDKRLRMVDTVKQYAAVRLEEAGELDAARHRLVTWLIDRAAAKDGSDEDSGRHEVPDVHPDDVLCGLGWAVTTGKVELAQRLAAATWQLWEASGRYVDGRELIDRVVALAPATTSPDAARAIVATANLALVAGDYATSRERFEVGIDALQTFGLTAEAAGARNSLSMVALFQGDRADARRLCLEALDDLSGLGDQDTGRAFALSALGLIEGHDGESTMAEQHMLEALTIFRRLGLRREAADVLNNLGSLAADAGEPGRAHRFYEGALQLQQRVGDKRGSALSLNNLCLAAQQRGNLDRAWEHAEAARQLFHEIGDRPGEAATVNNLANLAVERGNPREAIELYGQSIEAFRSMGDARRLATALENLADLAVTLEERQLAWTTIVDVASLWNHVSHGERLAAALAQLTRLAGDWGVTGIDALGRVDALDGDDQASVAHALESARWAAIPAAAPRRSEQGRGQLTARESQVVGLVGRGYSNAEIATRLFISERTVESHVSNARMKLGIDSRTRLTRWAIEHDLTE